jgi:hypothetical protein
MESVEILLLEAMDAYTPPELRALYEEIFRIRPGPRAGADFMRNNIAWAAQSIRDNRDPLELRTELTDKATRPSVGSRLGHRPGTCLIREWQGQTYEVTVLDTGYLWQGEKYRSLSRIAREITGAHWSGPRFFGLQEPG